jgi:hypothetical protein
MGYELHITRAPHWADSRDHPIAQDEWQSFARQDAGCAKRDRCPGRTSVTSRYTFLSRTMAPRCCCLGAKAPSMSGVRRKNPRGLTSL